MASRLAPPKGALGVSEERPDDVLRVVSASLDELCWYLAGRIDTCDEQPGEAEAERRGRSASHALKLRLAAHVLDGGSNEPRKVLQGRED